MMNGFVLISMLLFELAKIIYTIVLQRKYGFLDSKTLLVWEITQGLGLMGFVINTLLFHRMSFNDVIPSVYQTTGIWIVLISCGAEYVFLLVYVGIASVTYYKNRKVRNLFFMRNLEEHPFMRPDMKKEDDLASVNPSTKPVKRIMQLNDVSSSLKRFNRNPMGF